MFQQEVKAETRRPVGQEASTLTGNVPAGLPRQQKEETEEEKTQSTDSYVVLCLCGFKTAMSMATSPRAGSEVGREEGTDTRGTRHASRLAHWAWAHGAPLVGAGREAE